MRESVKWRNWLINEGLLVVTTGPYVIWIGIWVVAQIALFSTTFHLYATSPKYKSMRAFTKWGLSVARGSAAVINVSSGIILIPVCRNLISILRMTFVNRIFPLDHNIKIHKVLGWTICFWATIHSIAHFFNIMRYADSFGLPDQGIMGAATVLAYTSGVGLTGQLLVIIMLLIATSAVSKVRRNFFEQFWYSHHLYPLFFFILMAHGSFCFIKADTQPYCSTSPSFYKYWAASAVLFILERLLREYRARMPTFISKVIQHPSQVIELQIKKPSIKMHPGQYIFINCPELSLYQWHPFTLTSAPEEDFVSVHMRVVGDWTRDMAKRLMCEWDASGRPKQSKAKLGTQALKLLPQIRIDGPYGASSEDVFNFKVAVCVGAGIGVTPFGSVLKHIWYKFTTSPSLMGLEKVYFIWVCRDTEAFEWFRDVLVALEEEEQLRDFIEIRIHLTAKLKEEQRSNLILNSRSKKDAITGLNSATQFGRPNLEKLFVELKKSHPATDVGVFYCGPKQLGKSLYDNCNKHTTEGSQGTKFYFHKENF